MLGDFQGAAEDFQAAIEMGTFKGVEYRKEYRQKWIEALRKGINPFTPEVLESLKNDQDSLANPKVLRSSRK